jgi:hypothetical protein
MIDVDPTQASSVTAFMHRLWLVRIRAGNPSLGVLAKRTGIPKSTLHDGLHRGRSTLPSIDLVRRVLTALDSSTHEIRAWETAWFLLAVGPTTPDHSQDVRHTEDPALPAHWRERAAQPTRHDTPRRARPPCTARADRRPPGFSL